MFEEVLYIPEIEGIMIITIVHNKNSSKKANLYIPIIKRN